MNLKVLGDKMPDGVLFHSIRDVRTGEIKFDYVSGMWENIFGVSKKDTLADMQNVFKNILPDDFSMLLHKINEIDLLEPDKKLSIEIRYIHPQTKKELWLQISWYPVREGDYVVSDGFIFDITTRKKAEIELEKNREHLEFLVEERTKELKSANEELTVANEELNVINEEMNAANEELSTYRTKLEMLVENKTAELIVHKGYLENVRRRQEVIIKVLQIMQSTENISEALNLSLAEMGKFTDVSRVYVFEINSDGLTYSNICEWCNKNVEPFIEKEQNIPVAKVKPFFDSMEKNSLVSATDINTLPPALTEILVQQGVKSVICFPLSLGGVNFGFVGFDECSFNREWDTEEIALLKSLSQIVSNAIRRYRAEIQLVEEKKRLQAIGDNLPDGVLFRIVRNRETEKMYMEYVSATWKQVTGLAPEPVYDDITTFRNAIHPDDLKLLMDHTATSEQNLSYFDVSVRYGDLFNPRWLRIVSQPHRDGNKTVWDGLIRDVTERKKAQDELSKHHEHLEFLVKERTEELDAAIEELSATNEDLNNTNIELKVTVEELNAVNEELNAANDELFTYRTKLEKLVESKTAEVIVHQGYLEYLSQRQALLIKVLQIVQSADNLTEALSLSLAEMGKFTGVSRVYIFEKNDVKETYSNTYEWCNDGIDSVIISMQNIPIEQSHAWFDIFDAGGYICTSDVNSLTSETAQSLVAQGIKSIVAIPLSSYGVIFGYVGFDECVSNRVWEQTEIDLLRSLSQIVSSVIRRMNAEQEVMTLSRRQAILINVLQIVQSSQSLSNSLNLALAEMGKYLGIDRICIFEKNDDGNLFNNTYEWCNKNVKPVIKSLQNVSVEKIEQTFDIFPLSVGGKSYGFVGFAEINAKREKEEIDLLKNLTQIVSSTIRRHKAEMAIRQSEEMYRQLIAASPDPIVVCETCGRLHYMSPVALAMFALEDPNVKKMRVLKFIHPHERRGTLKLLERITNEDMIFYPQLLLLRNDGTSFYGEISASLVRDNNGEAIYIIMVVRDITQRKIDEMELIRAKEKAEESDKLKSAFLANISHEIRTPLNAIVGFLNILELGDLSQETVKECTGLINTNSTRLLQLIEDIIDVSKIEVEQMEILPVDLNINNLLNELNMFFNARLQAGNKEHINLILDDSGFIDSCVINVDAKRLRQILETLLANAIKFTEKGFIRFGYYLSSPSMLEFVVEDSGIGISADKLNVIFDSFRQAELSNSRRYEGAGLGLTLSRGLVELMGGKMWVESIEGEGTRFYFTIPYEQMM